VRMRNSGRPEPAPVPRIPIPRETLIMDAAATRSSAGSTAKCRGPGSSPGPLLRLASGQLRDLVPLPDQPAIAAAGVGA
jgi:hypothetical protein